MLLTKGLPPNVFKNICSQHEFKESTYDSGLRGYKNATISIKL